MAWPETYLLPYSRCIGWRLFAWVNATVNYRALGRTGLTVSEIGLGCWQLASNAWGTQDSHDAETIVQTALDQGCTFFDTAPGYGAGRSETLLGQALKGRRSHVVLCSKFGHPAEGPADFRVAALRPAIESSLKRLQTDYLDVLLVHSPPPEWLDGQRSGLYQALADLQQAGVLRAYGVSVDSLQDMQTAMRTTGCMVMELLFNAFHQNVKAGLDCAATQGIGLIAKVPLDSGWLAGRYSAHSRFGGVRDRWPPDVISRRAALVEQFAAVLPPGLTLAHAALGYVLAQPQIATVIPGARSPEQVLDNMAASQVNLEGRTVDAILALWQREIENEPLPW
jgi:aryl-alcohol dehydrogenase-like predicted oxidoreductase